MADFFLRTEDIRVDEIRDYFVETERDRSIIEALKGRNPVIVVGSRGVGKSFLLRIAQGELGQEFSAKKVFPVYLSFSKSSLLQTPDNEQFKHWMLAKISSAIVRALSRAGLLASIPSSLSVLAGQEIQANLQTTKIEAIAEAYENSWREPNCTIDASSVPTTDALKESIEDLCDDLGIRRFVLLIDEAAHVFLPEQQRQFFTLFRDLRSAYLTCNAAVYPGVTAFGDTFQPVHDATMLSIERSVSSSDYVKNMRQIVERQADSSLLARIEKYGQNFSVLAYASSGNPRVLLKLVARAPKMTSQQVNEVIREYFRTDVWSEHSTLAERYTGHKDIIDWGRNFIEGDVLPDLKAKNAQYLQDDKSASCYIWIHRDAPAVVREALRILAYTGIVSEQDAGIKASRGEIGSRYMINLGCIFSQESAPAASSFQIARSLNKRRMTEYGANHPSFKRLLELGPIPDGANISSVLATQLAKPIGVLDISDWLKGRLRSLSLNTIESVLTASEDKLQEAYYVGGVRSRRMKNAAISAVLEYLSG